MKNSTQKVFILIGIFVVLNTFFAFKYFQAQHEVIAGFADDSVVGQGTPVLLELGSHSCVPCKKMTPILEELNNEQTAFVVSFVDVWVVEGKSQQYGINSIPTQIFFDADGNELFRHVGFYPKDDILEKWNELGVNEPQ